MAEDHNCISQFFHEDTTSSQLNQSTEVQPHSSLCAEDQVLNSSQESQKSMDEALSLKQLTLDEVEPLPISPFFNITPRVMPLSPHYVFEEEFMSNPWALLIATIFLTKTSGKIARPYMKSFFEEYPTPYHVLEDNPFSLERFFLYLGLRKRAHMIWKLSYQFVSAKWRRAGDLCGVGKYGEDAYRIFCLGHTDLEPSDRYLKLYLDWLSGHTDFLSDNATEHSECFMDDAILKYYNLTLKDS